MKYAVVKIGGSQYKIKEGDEIEVDRLSAEDGEIELDNILLMIDGEKIIIGQPTIANLKIKAQIISHLKGDKVRVSRFKAKSRYRKVKGFRAYLTKLKIGTIGDAKTQKPATTETSKQRNKETQKSAKPKIRTSKKASE